jgi:hypothetical protein
VEKSSEYTYKTFVVTSSGRHEFSCGFIGRSRNCYYPPDFQNGTGSVWHHPIYHTVQWDLDIRSGPRSGQHRSSPRSAYVNYLQKAFPFEEYSGRLLGGCVPLLLGALSLFRAHKARNFQS